MVRYAILGPVELYDGERSVGLGGPRQVALLALLLVNANRALSNDRLIHALWDDRRSSGGVKRLHMAIARLRRKLDLESVPGRSALRTVAGGYLLAVQQGEMDAEVFQTHVQEGRRALQAGEAERARRVLRGALGMWRGPALAQVAREEFAQAEIAHLEELRLAALEARVDCDLRLGEHGAVVDELEAVVAAHRGRERLAAQLMLALYRCGRRAEALEVYARAQVYLSGELGVEPGPALKNLQCEILAQSPALQPVFDQLGAAASVAEQAAVLPTGVVTFLLTDVEGSTGLWEADADAMAAALEFHEGLIARLAERHGGQLLKDKGEGDATLSVFERASDAVACAAELQRTLSTTSWPSRSDLRLRIALHSGEAQERDRDYFGPVLNRAARLRSVAAGGVTVVSQTTSELVRDRLPRELQLVDIGRHELRGLSRPERIFELRTTAGTSAGGAGVPTGPIMLPLPRALHAPAGSVFVGRDAELARLGERWTKLSEMRSAVVIGGEAGIGKTRLAAELARTVHEKGALVLYGRCDEGLAVPYQPFVEALRPYAGALGLEGLRAKLGGLAPELGRLLPGLDGLGEPVRGDPEAERFALFEAVAALVEATTREQRALFVLDDLHWATSPTLLLLRHLVRSDRPLRALLLCTHRGTELGRDKPLAQLLADLHRDGSVEHLSIGGLDGPAIAALLEATVGKALDGRASQLVQVLGAQTAGNPLFLRELLAHASESGECLSLGVTAAQLEVPAGLRQVIGQRVARLSTLAGRVLSVAAVAGPTFSFVLLERVLGEAKGVLDALDEAVAAGLLSEAGRGDYVFAHALVRQTIYEELGTARRMRLHRQLGEALEALDADAHVEALAYHFAQAGPDGQGIKAATYGLVAGRSAAGRLGYEEAVGHYERGLEALTLSGRQQQQQRCELLLALGEARWGAGELHEARQACWQAAELAEKLGDAIALARAALGFCDSSRFEVAGAVALPVAGLLERALAALGEEDSALRAQLMGRLAACTDDTQRTTVLAHQALQMAGRVADKATLADVRASSLWASRGPDPVHESLTVATELVRVATEVGDDRLRTRAHGWLLDFLLEFGDVDAVRRELDSLQRLSEMRRERYFTWLLAVLRANRAHLRGRLEHRDALAHDALHHRIEFGRVDDSLIGLLQDACDALNGPDRFQRNAGLLTGVQGELVTDRHSGRKDKRVAIDERTAVIAQPIGQRSTLGSNLGHRFPTLWGPENSIQRLHMAGVVVALGQKVGDRELVLRGHISRIVSLMELGDWVGTDIELALHARLAEELRNPLHLWYVPLFKATRALLEGRLPDAEHFAREALAVGRGVQPQNAAQLYAVQIFGLRTEQGRLSEVEQSLEEFGRRYSAAPIWRAAVAFSQAELGRREDAQRTFEALTAIGAAEIPRDSDWLAAVALLIRTGARIGDVRRTRELGELLAPYADRAVVAAGGAICLGPVARFSGIAAATAGRSAEAASYLERAVATAHRWGARPMVAAIQLELAEVLRLSNLESTRSAGK